MKNALFLLLACLSGTMLLHAQTFNNSYTVDEQTYSSQASMVIDEDGSTVTVHTIREYTNSLEYDARVVKVDDQGNVLWSKQFGIPGVDDRANGICQTDDDGYLIVGVRNDDNLGYASWVFRIDNGGNLMWSRVYTDPDLFVSEGYLATRTFENDENYMIVGTANYPRRIFAIKIDANGNQYWSNQYYEPSLVNSKYDYVTSIVEDEERDGYIIAGTEHDYYTTGFPTLDLFTIGIDVNGNISRNYRKYDLDLGDYEFNPHIIHDLDNEGFLMSFGTRAGGVQNNTVSFISVMTLFSDLTPDNGYLYASPNAYESHANSIYADPHGFYDLGCFMYDGIEGQPNGVRNASFLRLDPTAAPLNYFRYNVDQDQTCTFMAQDFTGLHENYVLKTDHMANGVWSIGLIRTELNGESDCAEDEPINYYDSGVNFWMQGYKTYNFAETKESPVKEWKNAPKTIHCEDLHFTNDEPVSSFLDAPGHDNFDPISTEAIRNINNDIIAYPSLVDGKGKDISLEFSTSTDTRIQILIYNTQGQLVYQTWQETTTGFNKHTISQTKLSQGLNTIVILENNQSLGTARVVKL